MMLYLLQECLEGKVSAVEVFKLIKKRAGFTIFIFVPNRAWQGLAAQTSGNKGAGPPSVPASKETVGRLIGGSGAATLFGDLEPTRFSAAFLEFPAILHIRSLF